MSEPKWIVNDMGELGVMVDGRAYFLYKGDNIEYESGLHDDGTPIMYRMVGKREFGETCQPLPHLRAKWPGWQYLEPLVYTPGLSFGKPEDGEWQPLPADGVTAAPASIHEVKLPPVPEHDEVITNGYGSGHSDHQLQEYARRAVLEDRAARGVAPSLADELTQAKRAGFMFGWKAAAVWANRDDLIADIGSPAYEKDCDAACGVKGPDDETKA